MNELTYVVKMMRVGEYHFTWQLLERVDGTVVRTRYVGSNDPIKLEIGDVLKVEVPIIRNDSRTVGES